MKNHFKGNGNLSFKQSTHCARIFIQCARYTKFPETEVLSLNFLREINTYGEIHSFPNWLTVSHETDVEYRTIFKLDNLDSRMKLQFHDLHMELELDSDEMALIVTYLAFLALLRILGTINHAICHAIHHDFDLEDY